MTKRTKPSQSNEPRPKRLTPERILDAAQSVADQEGVTTLSMRRLAHALGVEAMSLYNHYPNKDAILDGLVEQAMSEIEVPLVGVPWREAMRARALSARAACLRHRWLPALAESRTKAGPARLRLCNAVLAVLEEAGFSLELSELAFLTLDSFIYGYTLQEANWPYRPEQQQEAVESFVENTTLSDFPHIAALAEQVRQAPSRTVDYYERQFELGLELILDGLERSLGSLERSPSEP